MSSKVRHQLFTQNQQKCNNVSLRARWKVKVIIMHTYVFMQIKFQFLYNFISFSTAKFLEISRIV